MSAGKSPAPWRCAGRYCPAQYSRAWHRRMVERIETTEGPEAARDFERAHPEAHA